jgi:hypothetical protein
MRTRSDRLAREQSAHLALDGDVDTYASSSEGKRERNLRAA